MTQGQNASDDGIGERKAYSVSVHAKAQSSTSCSFCYFVLTLYPTLKGMPDGDTATFKLHLQRAHGLQNEIQA